MSFTRNIHSWRDTARTGWSAWARQVSVPDFPEELPAHFVDRYAYRCYRAPGSPAESAMRLPPAARAQRRAASWDDRISSIWTAKTHGGAPPPPLDARVSDSPGPRAQLLVRWRKHLARHGVVPPRHLFQADPDETWADLLARSVHAPLGRPAIPGPTFYERLSPVSRAVVDARFGPDALWSLYAFLLQCHEETHLLQSGEPLLGEVALAWMWCSFLDAEDLWCWQETEPGGETFNIEAPWVRRLDLCRAAGGLLFRDTLCGVRAHFGGDEPYDGLCEVGWEFDLKRIRYHEYLERVVCLWNQ